MPHAVITINEATTVVAIKVSIMATEPTGDSASNRIHL
jgi:hypothetical protein